MAGVSRKHNVIVDSLIYLLQQCLRSKTCEVYPSDLQVLIPACGRYVYSYVVVV